MEAMTSYICDTTCHQRMPSETPCRAARRALLANYARVTSSTFLSEQASSTILLEQTSTSHQPPANRTGCRAPPAHGANSYSYAQSNRMLTKN
jgi:hypothetical protein